jgi:hypothetical protein
MKFHFGSLPEYDSFEPTTPWQAFDDNETSIWQWQFRALPVAILNIAIIVALWAAFTPISEIFMDISFPLPILKAISCLLGVLVVHELIHGAVHPEAGFSNRTIFGFWPSRMFLYVTYAGELNRSRYLSILVAPLLMICFIPIVISVTLKIQSFWLFYITVLNALFSSGDILAIYEILKLPKNAVIRNQGSKAYWKIVPN